MADAVSDVGQLLDLLGLEASDVDALTSDGSKEARTVLRDFPLRVPQGFVARMCPGDPNDPLLLQVLPIGNELLPAPGYVDDPLSEGDVNPVPGLLHKYRGRALLVVTGACAVHCRYCFRRHFPYAEQRVGDRDWRRALDYIAADPSIREVILSGGDPLSLADTRLSRLACDIAEIPHVRRLRLHSRQPIVLPERVDDALLAWLGQVAHLRPVLVVHANHPNEIHDPVREALARLRRIGVTLLNQAVLLKGVNDDVATLEKLSETLFEAGVLPYYLHTLDPVQGAAHFEIDEDTARHLVQRLSAELPGYLVPRLGREVPGAPAKTPIGLTTAKAE